MRDPETARIAIQAAMTGHLVFSTLHTNDAASALTRLVDLQVEPYMVAAAVEGILAQRLVRRICQECREACEPNPELLALVAAGERDAGCTMQHGAGCQACRFTGYRGRLGVYELLELTDELRELLGRGSSLQDLRRAARNAGMRSLREDGWHKARSGLTTVEEVVRVIQA
jgi:type IV pilus assembly protein PilB